tara:strand:+ start:1478 stop:1651 length:174 start_codon:yes stop_codon:yes gene_type:complete
MYQVALYTKNIFNNIFFSEENIKEKVNSLLKELKDKTGVSDEEMDEFKEIIDHSDIS